MVTISKGRTILAGQSPKKKRAIEHRFSVEDLSIVPGAVCGDFGPAGGQSIPQDSHRDSSDQRAGQEVQSLLCGRHGG